MGNFRERLENLRARIKRAAEKCGRDPNSISLLAVSKFHPVQVMQEAVQCGIAHFAENYVQEAAKKSAALPDATFALIGSLQRNKAKPALQTFSELMTVDRPELAERLARLSEELGLCRDVWIQIDLWGEATKMGGCVPEIIQPVLDSLGVSPRLAFKGFMAIPPMGMVSAFSDLASLREAWQQCLGKRVLLSMGMSDDLEDAIVAGSDQIRVGTALFGDRADIKAQ